MASQDLIHIGGIYGRLKAISLPYRNNKNRWVVDCECQCENKTLRTVRVDALLSGSTKGCGCVAKENAKIAGHNTHKTNIYDLTNECGIGYTSNKNEYGENFFYFDLEDYEKIKDYCWCFDKDGYLMTMDKKKNVKMHRLIMDCPPNLEVDHIGHRINGGGTENDNRKINLRICEHYQNCSNRLSGKNNSGAIGVNLTKSNKWKASIHVNGNNIIIGHFDNFDDAVKARKDAEDVYFGEYSYDNSMKISHEYLT